MLRSLIADSSSRAEFGVKSIHEIFHLDNLPFHLHKERRFRFNLQFNDEDGKLVKFTLKSHRVKTVKFPFPIQENEESSMNSRLSDSI